MFQDVLEFHYDWDERETVVIATSFNTTTGKSHTSTIRLDYKFVRIRYIPILSILFAGISSCDLVLFPTCKTHLFRLHIL